MVFHQGEDKKKKKKRKDKKEKETNTYLQSIIKVVL